MNKYKCVFTVDGRRTEQIITANTSFDAKKLIEAQYQNCRILWTSCIRIG